MIVTQEAAAMKIAELCQEIQEAHATLRELAEGWDVEVELGLTGLDGFAVNVGFDPNWESSDSDFWYSSNC